MSIEDNQPDFGPGYSGSGEGPQDPDGDSSEDVKEDLERLEEELRRAQNLPDDDDHTYRPYGVNEEESQTGEEFAESIQEALGRVGLQHAYAITPERLSAVDPEILKKLNPHTAESLYFDTYKFSRKWLGNDYIKPTALFSRAKAFQLRGMDLEKIQLVQRAEALWPLQWAGFDSEEIIQALSGDEERRQNINRLHFYFFHEPRLKKFTENLHKRAELEGPWGIEATVMEAQEKLGLELDEIDKAVARDSNPETSLTPWDITVEKFYNRTSHRIGSSMAVGKLILKTLRGENPNQSPDPFDM